MTPTHNTRADLSSSVVDRNARDGQQPLDGRRRVAVERVQPEIDAGRFPIKRTVGEMVSVVADVFADGHDLLAGVVKYRQATGPKDPSYVTNKDHYGS